MGIFQFNQEFLIHIWQDEINGVINTSGFVAIEANAQIVEEQLSIHRHNRISTRRFGC
ncbi:Uncharacterised protein [Vibrio cholerae]|uniref:Uncharacterized protein n=1 Tax=Vibrio cholerae TaxID=666 RepID=A0A655R5F1_VIBCL|nr:Uncharacterised protein [Vibrio cholerae]CSA85409.1 Uncharacterised protein [Vibrio cholerae]